MDKTSETGLEGQVSFGWTHKGMAPQAAGIQGTKSGAGESTEQGGGGNGGMEHHVQRGGRRWCWNPGLEPNQQGP